MSHSPGLNDVWEIADGIDCDERTRSAADRDFVEGGCPADDPFIDNCYPMSELEMIEAPAGIETLLRSQAASNEIEIARGTPIEPCGFGLRFRF